MQLVDLYSRIVTAHIYENLYDYDHLARPFKINPCTADGMPKVSDDFRVWTVRVKPGIHFQHDPAFEGRRRELVAEDFVYTLKRFFDPRWKSPAYASVNELGMLGLESLREAALKNKTPFDYDAPVEGLRALDRYTVQYRFDKPQPRFLYSLAGGDVAGAVAREVIEAYGDDIQHIRSAPGHSVLRNGAARRGSCWNAIPAIARCCTTPNRMPTMRRGRHFWPSSRAAGCR